MSNFKTIRQSDGRWIVKKEGSNRTFSHHSTKSSAWKETRRLARGAETEAILEDLDGNVYTRNSYCSDPYPQKV